MGKPSTIATLPPDILEKLQTLLRDPRVTQLAATRRINEILAADGHEAQVSKSAVNRYAMRMEQVGQKLRETREIAKMWIGRLGAEPQGEVGKLLNELVRTLAFRAAMRASEAGEDDPIDPKLLKSLAISVYRLERAASENADLEEKIRRQERDRLKKRAEAAIDEAERDKQAMTPERFKQVIREAYGV